MKINLLLLLSVALLALACSPSGRAETHAGPVCSAATNKLPATLSVPPATASTTTTATVLLNFEDADIITVLGYLAELTGQTIIPTPSCKGSVTIISPKPVTRSAAKQIIYSALLEQGYTLVRMSHGIKIIRAENATSSPIPVSPSSRN